jgi:hypothetical protein
MALDRLRMLKAQGCPIAAQRVRIAGQQAGNHIKVSPVNSPAVLFMAGQEHRRRVCVKGLGLAYGQPVIIVFSDRVSHG